MRRALGYKGAEIQRIPGQAFAFQPAPEEVFLPTAGSQVRRDLTRLPSNGKGSTLAGSALRIKHRRIRQSDDGGRLRIAYLPKGVDVD